MSAFDHTAGINVFCDVCHGRMTQSKNDPNIFCCYQCNDKKTRQEARIGLEVVPKSPSPNREYKEPFYFAADNFTIAAEPDTVAGQFELMGKEYAREYLREHNPQQYEIEEKFKKVLGTDKVKVAFKERNAINK